MTKPFFIRNTVSGLRVPNVRFSHLDQAYAWIEQQLRPQDFEVERDVSG